MATYAIDFDGYLCEDEWPNIGKPHEETLDFVCQLKKSGNKIILWTCREGKRLEDAVAWCFARGIHFDAVNENLSENIVKYGGDCRKIFADCYCDDKNYREVRHD